MRLLALVTTLFSMPFTAQELKTYVLREFGTRNITRSGWSFRPHLLALPKRRRYKAPYSTAKPMLWTILILKDKEGVEHHVVYDEDEDCFGVAVAGTYIGICGTFLQTLDTLP